MNTNKILKNTLKFMVSFIILTILSIALLFFLILFFPSKSAVSNYMPVTDVFELEDLDWNKIEEIGGVGLLLDPKGNILEKYNYDDAKDSYSESEILSMLSMNRDIISLSNIFFREKTTLLYDMEGGNRLLLIYPESIVNKSININMDALSNRDNLTFPMKLLLVLVLYLFSLFFIIKRLSKSLNLELKKINDYENVKKDEFFRGLAHDIKTPLSSMLALSSALKDNLVSDDKKQNYYDGIYRNGNILRDRINDMMDLTLLSEIGIYNPKEGDILEFIRRYVGENYTWYLENSGEIEILYEDKEQKIIKFDEKLFERVLQNILQNSINHNQWFVKIQIDYDKNAKKLIFTDSGKGVPESIVDTIFDPMITGDKSRTGEKLRGMGLANVKRIIDLHGWTIAYNNGFEISLLG